VKLTTDLHIVPRTKNAWSYTSTRQNAFMAWCSVKTQGQLYFTVPNSVQIGIMSNKRTKKTLLGMTIRKCS
jgi:hypothetical protein